MNRSLTIGLLSLLAIAVGEVSKPAPAQAGETCNYINRNLFMAQAYRNQDNIWITEGWWKIEPGTCVVYSDNVSTYFKVGENTTPPRPKMADSTKAELCIVNNRFTVYQADNIAACGSQEGTMASFIGLNNQRELLTEPN